jgi:hypothetical protein
MADDLDAAWDAVHEAVPARWMVGRTTFDPAGDGSWSVWAVGRTKRGEIPQSLIGTGATEVEALRDLDDRLGCREA